MGKETRQRMTFYAYATSEAAKAAGFEKTGCYILALVSKSGKRETIFASEDHEAVRAEFEKLDNPINYWSLDGGGWRTGSPRELCQNTKR